MIDDYYATLGVEPRSEAAAIRAAYLALMRQYHPDKNDSPAALERAHAIIAAFKVLGDAERRLHYDWARRRAAEAAAQPPQVRFGKMPRAVTAAVIGLLVVVLLSFMQFPVAVRDQPVPARTPAVEVKVAPVEVKREDAVERPLAAMTPVVDRQPTVEIEPVKAEPAAAPSPPIIEKVLLAPAAAPRLPPAPRKPRQASNAFALDKAPASVPEKCRLVRPGAEAAICINDDLSALDRSVVTFYNQSLQYGVATKRGALLDSRTAFLARREACRSDACLQSLHLAHLRELSAIMEGRPADALR